MRIRAESRLPEPLSTVYRGGMFTLWSPPQPIRLMPSGLVRLPNYEQASQVEAWEPDRWRD
jgi:hypothetical protein